MAVKTSRIASPESRFIPNTYGGELEVVTHRVLSGSPTATKRQLLISQGHMAGSNSMAHIVDSLLRAADASESEMGLYVHTFEHAYGGKPKEVGHRAQRALDVGRHVMLRSELPAVFIGHSEGNHAAAFSLLRESALLELAQGAVWCNPVGIADFPGSKVVERDLDDIFNAIKSPDARPVPRRALSYAVRPELRWTFRNYGNPDVRKAVSTVAGNIGRLIASRAPFGEGDSILTTSLVGSLCSLDEYGLPQTIIAGENDRLAGGRAIGPPLLDSGYSGGLEFYQTGHFQTLLDNSIIGRVTDLSIGYMTASAN